MDPTVQMVMPERVYAVKGFDMPSSKPVPSLSRLVPAKLSLSFCSASLF